MTPKEKKAFVARMKKGKKNASKGKSKSNRAGKSATKPKKKLNSSLESGKYKREFVPNWLANKWYNEYKRLNGKKSKKQFLKNVDIFEFHTWDIFIHGDTTKYKTRKQALSAVRNDAKISQKELDLIFHSIDNITAYT